MAWRFLAFALAMVVVLALSACAFVPGETGRSPARAQGEGLAIEAVNDASMTPEEEEEAYNASHRGHPRVNPLIAQCEGVDVRSPIAPADLTGVLFHQASYRYAITLSTALPESDAAEVESTGAPRVNRSQIDGEWIDADALHLWRVSDDTDMDTSIDVGAPAGTILRSPVTGTVVLVKDYMLYDEVPDIELHMQPDGRPDLDVVVIHTYDPLVKAGDRVEAGVTELSHVRDIAKDLDDVQLAFYTPEGDPGNHVHVQVNDANFEGYRQSKLDGAVAAAS